MGLSWSCARVWDMHMAGQPLITSRYRLLCVTRRLSSVSRACSLVPHPAARPYLPPTAPSRTTPCAPHTSHCTASARLGAAASLHGVRASRPSGSAPPAAALHRACPALSSAALRGTPSAVAPREKAAGARAHSTQPKKKRRSRGRGDRGEPGAQRGRIVAARERPPSLSSRPWERSLSCWWPTA